MPPGTDQRARVSRAVGVSAQATRPTLASVSTSSSGRGSEPRGVGVGHYVLGLDPAVSITGGAAQVQSGSLTLSSSALPSSKGPAFSDKGGLGMRCWQLRS